jgi:hypothetical protein
MSAKLEVIDMSEMSPAARKEMNRVYRAEESPSDLHKTAFQEVITTGSLSERTEAELVAQLYGAFDSRYTNTPVDPWEPTLATDDTGNGLAKAVTQHRDGIRVHISKRLFHRQPIGVLLRPITDNIFQAGEALITKITPRSDTVEADVMPANHYAITVVPTPIWLTRWICENGYNTVDGGR